MRRRALLFVVFVVVAFSGGEAFAAAWQPPVGSPVTDPWRPPEHRYAAGNRGVDFSPPKDVPVVAAGSGTISFVGSVGGPLYVVVDHAGGLRTTYGDLATAAVTVGDEVAAGQEVGRSTSHLHFGLRIEGEYADPNLLFGRAQLVPDSGEPAGIDLAGS